MAPLDAALDAPDPAGFTPLQAAVLFDDADMVAHLLAHDADPQTVIRRPRTRIDAVTAAKFLSGMLLRDARMVDCSAVRVALAGATPKRQADGQEKQDARNARGQGGCGQGGYFSRKTMRPLLRS